MIEIGIIWLLSLKIVSFLHYAGYLPYKSRVIVYSNSCTVPKLSILLTSCLTTIHITL